MVIEEEDRLDLEEEAEVIYKSPRAHKKFPCAETRTDLVAAQDEVVSSNRALVRLPRCLVSLAVPCDVFRTDFFAELGTFLHASEGEMVCESVNPKIPYFNAPIYLENKVRRVMV